MSRPRDHRCNDKNCPECRARAAADAASSPKPAASRAELDRLLNRIAELASKNPDKAAVILSLWINGHQKKSKKKAA